MNALALTDGIGYGKLFGTEAESFFDDVSTNKTMPRMIPVGRVARSEIDKK